MPIPFPKTILVTGATGFLGGRLLERLLTQPGLERIVATGRNAAGAALAGPRCVFAAGDLTDAVFVETLFQRFAPEAVVHAAARSSPWGNQADFWADNVLATQHLLAKSLKYNVLRFVNIATPSVYFNFRDRLDIRESDPLPRRLVNAYAETKLRAEEAVLSANGPGLQTLSLRPRALIGRGDTVIMPRLLRAYHEGRLRRVGSGQNQVDLTAVANATEAIVLALTAPASACGHTYNLSSGEPVRLWEFIEMLFQKLRLPLKIKSLIYPAAYAAAALMEARARYFQPQHEPALTRYGVGILAKSCTLNIEKARQYLGYQPRQTTLEALDEFVAWYQTTPTENRTIFHENR